MTNRANRPLEPTGLEVGVTSENPEHVTSNITYGGGLTVTLQLTPDSADDYADKLKKWAKRVRNNEVKQRPPRQSSGVKLDRDRQSRLDS